MALLLVAHVPGWLAPAPILGRAVALRSFATLATKSAQRLPKSIPPVAYGEEMSSLVLSTIVHSSWSGPTQRINSGLKQVLERINSS